MENYKLIPFTKWTGGKRQLLPHLIKNLPNKFNRYFEPFVGGGALFFKLQPKNSVINDLNSELITTYKVIKDEIEELINLLKIHKELNSKEYYLKIRNMDREKNITEYNNVKRVARFIYMLRVNFNGIYRVNSKNQFNVPYGKYLNPKILDEELLRKISHFLNENNTLILNTDFENSLLEAKKGDLVYLDPPYIPISKTSSFTSYTREGFNYDEQLRLKKLVDKLTKKEVFVMQSNSYSEITKELYKNYNIKEVLASRMINSKVENRGKIKEVIITNY